MEARKFGRIQSSHYAKLFRCVVTQRTASVFDHRTINKFNYTSMVLTHWFVPVAERKQVWRPSLWCPEWQL
jgi:hypothetical protein